MEQITKIESELKPIENEVLTLKDQAEAMTIASEDDYQKATDAVGVVTDKKKQIEKLRKFFVDPLNKQVKDINSMFKPQTEQADEIITIIKRKMAKWWNDQEEKRRKEEARLQAIRDKANEKRAEQGKEMIQEPVKQVAEVERTTTSDKAQSTVKKRWTHKIVSMEKLPDDVKKAVWAEAYKKGIVDTVVRKFVQAGVREMAGVEIYQETDIAVKSS